MSRDDRSSRRGRDEDEDDRSSRRGRDDDRGGRRGGSRFQYHQRDAASAKKRAESSGKDFDRYLEDVADAFVISDDNVIRILPPTFDDAEHYGHDIYVHYEIGPDKGTYLCLNKMKGEKCPICEERKRAQNSGDEEYAKKLEPKKRVLVYVIDRNKEKEGIKVWAMPWTLDRDIVKVSVDKRTGEVLPIDHPDDGYDVLFERTGKGPRTEYVGVSIDRKSSPLDNDKALDFAQDHPLPTLLKFYSYDHIASVFDGGSPPAGGGDRRRDHDDDDDRRGSRSDRSDRGGRDRDERDSGRRGADDDRRDKRSSAQEDGHTWESIHEMNYDELCDLVDEQKLDIDPDKAKTDEDLADWVCEEMKIDQPRKRSRGDDDDDGRGDARRRLDSMRRGRD